MDLPVSEIHGVGPKLLEQLAAMGITTVRELLEHFPFRYEDHTVRPIMEAEHEERITVRGTVHSEPSLRFYGRNKSRLTVRMLVDGLLIQAVFFNQGYLKKQMQLGESIVVSGKFDRHRLMLSGGTLKAAKASPEEGLEPVYSVKGDLKLNQLKTLIRQAFQQFGERIEEILPAQLLTAYRLIGRKETLKFLHFPASPQELRQARRRMIYEELLLFQLKMQMLRKIEREAEPGQKKNICQERLEELLSGLPFQLTQAQQRVLKEIVADLQGDYRMNRLLQGDVGSGKTVIAGCALFANANAGYQGALMVPTEILAEQHYESLRELLEPYQLKVRLLSGSAKAKERRELAEELQAGSINVLVGTHALIQEGVHFHKLGLVITDEQHRFGVEQRRALRKKGIRPDVLFMTATPIPRTLSISAFGDMDVSIIDEMPAGRKPIKTHWAKPAMFSRVIEFVKKEVEKGYQAYVICPLIEESEKLDVQNAIDVHQQLQQLLSGIQIGLMHGRLSAAEKDAVMEAFAANRVQILVSTTVVEVGVNVPNATVMVIYDAERFGLAQLHQLRGRVGRGQAQSHCILLADPKSDVGKERMHIMTETNDGFELSERDLELRGPGDFFGHKQSGLPVFKVADIVEDFRVLEVARQDAVKLVHSTAFWQGEDYEQLRRCIAMEEIFQHGKLD
ncbi:ATP-dependent DNA helicase RecG [Evansella caseinilytica]|uniref:ATP-dependent DNA helicase RecG n=1 Tax=Evansella caseinilytica TaxID=1503961 RepID=A0A1H3MC13_9BACI|nr:ATP-dependent DNA helicase RecG [Evansella caseinilytica]SDY73739.1 ATP-dependent DNA helicase RecG [Evansella caseinilytica]